jgi:outer membrane protein assembly factor BamB
LKASLEPVLQALTRDYQDVRVPSGARLEDLVQALDAAVAAMPESALAGFDLGLVLCRGRGLYLLHSKALTPQFSLGGPPQVLQSTLHVRVKELPLLGSNGEPLRLASQLQLSRVFFEDEDQAVLWLRGSAAEAADHTTLPAMQAARIILNKDAAAEEEGLQDTAAVWPEEEDETGQDRVRMSYVALALIVVVFVTALFGMSRWRNMGDENGPDASFLAEGVDSSLDASAPARVSGEVSEGRAPATGGDAVVAAAHVEEPAADTPLQLLWSKSYRDWVTSSPRVAQGNVVYGCRDGHLYAVRSGGEPIWEYDSGAGIGATPEVDGTRVFCGNYAGRTFALRALDGAQLWAHDLGARIVASPALGKNLVFFQTYGGDVYGMDQKTGRVEWKRHLGGQLRARALPAGKNVLVLSGDGDLLSLQQKNGEVTWSVSLGARVISNPTRVKDRVIVAARDGFVHAVDLEKGEIAWRVQLGGALESGVASDGERIYVGSNDRHVYALRQDDGGILWRFRTSGPVRSTPCVEGEQVYVTSYDRHTYVLEAETGASLAQLALAAPIYSSPLVHDGRLYFGSNDGTFYCLSARR